MSKETFKEKIENIYRTAWISFSLVRKEIATDTTITVTFHLKKIRKPLLTCVFKFAINVYFNGAWQSVNFLQLNE